MSYADMVLATVPAAPPTRKNLRATSWPAPTSANVPYLAASRLIPRAFSSVAISIAGFIQLLYWQFLPPQIPTGMPSCRRLSQTPLLLEPHSLSVFCWNPAAQIVWQRCIHPVAARAENFDLAPGRQCQNAIGCVRGRQARLDVFAGDNTKRVAFTAALELPGRKYPSATHHKHHK